MGRHLQVNKIVKIYLFRIYLFKDDAKIVRHFEEDYFKIIIAVETTAVSLKIVIKQYIVKE